MNMSLENKVKEYLGRVKFRSIVVLVLFIIFVAIFLGVWATIGFALPAFVTDPKLIEKAGLFAFWTVGAILFGAGLAAFIIGRGLGKAVEGK
jgi:hypothetical protein